MVKFDIKYQMEALGGQRCGKIQKLDQLENKRRTVLHNKKNSLLKGYVQESHSIFARKNAHIFVTHSKCLLNNSRLSLVDYELRFLQNST